MHSFFVVLCQSVVDLHRRTLQPGEAITQRMSTRDDEEIMPAQERGGGKKRTAKDQTSHNPGGNRQASKGIKRKRDEPRPKRKGKSSRGGQQSNPKGPYIAERENPIKRKLTMVTINVNGIKVPGKSLLLGHFLHQENLDICVAVETHITTQESKTLALEGLE